MDTSFIERSLTVDFEQIDLATDHTTDPEPYRHYRYRRQFCEVEETGRQLSRALSLSQREDTFLHRIAHQGDL